MEKKVEVITDTDFLSSFFKIKRLDLIFRAFNVNKIFITRAVLHELEGSIFYDEFFKLIGEGRIMVKEAKRIESSTDFGKGELESISFAEKIKSVLLMNDRVAGKFARSRGVVVVDISEFLLDCKNKNIISSKEISQIIKNLREKDYYEFSKETEKLLLLNKE